MHFPHYFKNKKVSHWQFERAEIKQADHPQLSRAGLRVSHAVNVVDTEDYFAQIAQ
jgi:hypothetical protein